ncbi:hypothetical protein PMI31_01597 [Pseudomonas sp. GM55]|nr:hypothetical protein PMI31_01597 [Pseudomonas sp. GM55]
MATGNHNLIGHGRWRDGSHLHCFFRLWSDSRRRNRCPRSLYPIKNASLLPSVRCGLFNRRHLCFLDLLILPLLYRNQALPGLGWGIRGQSLLGRLDQLEVAVA